MDEIDFLILLGMMSLLFSENISVSNNTPKRYTNEAISPLAAA